MSDYGHAAAILEVVNCGPANAIRAKAGDDLIRHLDLAPAVQHLVLEWTIATRQYAYPRSIPLAPLLTIERELSRNEEGTLPPFSRKTSALVRFCNQVGVSVENGTVDDLFERSIAYRNELQSVASGKQQYL